MNRFRTSSRISADVRRLISTLKSFWFSSIKWESVSRLCGIRAMICSFVSRSVSETLIVRSKGSMPLWTFTSAPIVARIAIAQPMTVRRKRFRVTSIFLASEISSVRASSGICRHLAQIHADRIAAELRQIARQRRRLDGAAGHFPLGQLLGALLLGVHRLERVVELGRRRLVHQVDPLFLQGDQQVVELVGIDFLVGKIAVHLVIGKIALRFSAGDQPLQILIEKVHRTTPFAPSIGALGIKESPFQGTRPLPWVWKCLADSVAASPLSQRERGNVCPSPFGRRAGGEGSVG